MKPSTAKRLLAALLAAASVVCSAWGSAKGFSGEYVREWDGYSLLYAKILAVTNTARSEYQLTVEPLATLTGTFDCGLSARLSVRLYTGYTSRIKAAPDAGTRVLILLGERSPSAAGAQPRKDYFASSDMVAFMPGGSGCVQVSGMDDSAVAEVMEKVRTARAAARRFPGEEEKIQPGGEKNGVP